MTKRSQDIFENIERYLGGEMNQAERESFESHLASNPELRIEVEKHKDLKEALSDPATIEFRKKVATIQEREGQKKTVIPSGIWRVAAVFLLLIGLTGVLWVSFTDGEEILFDKYYSPFPVESPLRGSDNTLENDAITLYSTGNYQEAVPALQSRVNQEPANSTLKIYLGNSYIETGAISSAIDVFESISSEDPEYETAQWYLALSLLKQDRLEDSSAILTRIIAFNGIYKDRAQSLRQEILNQSPDDS